ncbi:MAG: DUF2878 domain-containing protein, partial [Burkholderiales bacterium]
MSNAINIVAFQAGWFACILSAANGMPWLAAGVSLAVVLLHLARAHDVRAELKLALAAGIAGAMFENALALAGWTGFEGGVLIAGSAPLWMVAQWMMFATTLNLSLAWMKSRLLLAALFGAIGAPLSYLGGERLGALQILDRDAALWALGLGWALLAPLLLILA